MNVLDIIAEAATAIAGELAEAETALVRAETEAADAERDLAEARQLPAELKAAIAGLPDPGGRLADRLRRRPDIRPLENRAAQAREARANAVYRVSVLRSEAAEIALAIERANTQPAPVPGSAEEDERLYAMAYPGEEP